MRVKDEKKHSGREKPKEMIGVAHGRSQEMVFGFTVNSC
jgi:hypothetical protein